MVSLVAYVALCVSASVLGPCPPVTDTQPSTFMSYVIDRLSAEDCRATVTARTLPTLPPGLPDLTRAALQCETNQ
jgi:hypothetical protein